MPQSNIPQWVFQAFVRSATSAGATASRTEIEQLASELMTIWSAPERKFHNQFHLVAMLARIDTLASETQDADLVRLAAWGHGIVFTLDPEQVMAHNGGEQELLSADAAVEHYRTIGIPEDKLSRIHDLIRAMHKRHDDGSLAPSTETARFDSIDIDRLALFDAHFGALAEDPQRYKAYLKAIREEYQQINDLDWLRARIMITSHLLARKRLFFSPLAAAWEPIARQNLTAELERAKVSLETLEAEELNAVQPESDRSESGSSDAGLPHADSHDADLPKDEAVTAAQASAAPDAATQSSAAEVFTTQEVAAENSVVGTALCAAVTTPSPAGTAPSPAATAPSPAATAKPATDHTVSTAKPAGLNDTGTVVDTTAAGVRTAQTVVDTTTRRDPEVVKTPSQADEPPAKPSTSPAPETSSLAREPEDFYDEYSDDFRVVTPAVRAQNTPRSSLEDFDERYEPGTPPRILTPEEAEAARRAAISQSTFDAIERKRKEEDELREAKRRDSSVENDPDY